MFNASFDHEADALYITLRVGTVKRTVEIEASTLVDVDEHGNALGIEVIHPSRNWAVEQVIDTFHIVGKERDMLRALFPQFRGGAGRVSFPARGQRVSTRTRRLRLQSA